MSDIFHEGMTANQAMNRVLGAFSKENYSKDLIVAASQKFSNVRVDKIRLDEDLYINQNILELLMSFQDLYEVEGQLLSVSVDCSPLLKKLDNYHLVMIAPDIPLDMENLMGSLVRINHGKKLCCAHIEIKKYFPSVSSSQQGTAIQYKQLGSLTVWVSGDVRYLSLQGELRVKRLGIDIKKFGVNAYFKNDKNLIDLSKLPISYLIHRDNLLVFPSWLDPGDIKDILSLGHACCLNDHFVKLFKIEFKTRLSLRECKDEKGKIIEMPMFYNVKGLSSIVNEKDAKEMIHKIFPRICHYSI